MAPQLSPQSVSFPATTDPRTLIAAPAVLRAGLAIVFIAHGAQKLFGWLGGGGITGTGDYFASLGAHPGALWAVTAGLVEFGGGAAVAVGLLTRPTAALLAVDMFLAIILTNWENGFFAEKASGGWEINLVLICMAASLVCTGAGRFSVDRCIGARLAPGARAAAAFR
ncbi:DoxX family protein [Streptomyces sp. NPDC091280]|uniref:DoxX family protein n=1 Tax=Streptomyces sp. NPDC091280 TaxID=3365984 RepID=UPI0037F64FE8